MDDKFLELYKIDVSGKTEKKGNLTYLSWCWAWAEFKKVYPDANYEVKKFDGIPYVHDTDTGYMVYTSVTAGGMTYEMWLPVMDTRNKAMKTADMFDINKTIMRCLTKNLAMFGLGLYIYAGEDLPEDAEKPPKEGTKAKQTGKTEAWKLTKSELVQVYGVKNAEATIAALEKKLGVPYAEWNQETTQKVRETLERMKKRNNEEMEKYRSELEKTDDDDLPF